MCSIYMDGRIKDEQLYEEIYSIVHDVISLYTPTLTEDEVKARSEMLAKQIVNAIKIETVRRRMIGRFRITI